MKVVFLHGIGDGDPERKWLATLNQALGAEGYTAIEDRDVIAPRYDSYLSTTGISAKMPDVTYKVKDDSRVRLEFERRQAAVQRLLQHEPEVATFGFNSVPKDFMAAAQAFGVDRLPVMDLDQVRRYVENDGLRGAILRYVLDQLPRRGDILLIAHSLGSVIAIDLLDHLPEQLHVRRFITIGSPASSPALHRGSERLLKKIPYSRMDDWTNIFSIGDIVPMGRGLAAFFPGAQDFQINLGAGRHGTEHYLAHPAIVTLVSNILYPSKELVRSSSDIAVRLPDEQFEGLVKMHFAAEVGRHITDDKARMRYLAANKLLQDDAAAQLRELAQSGVPMPVELQSVIDGRLPKLPERLDLRQAVIMLMMHSADNFVDPYDISTGDAPKAALGPMLSKLGFSGKQGEHMVTALTEVDAALKRNGGIPWGRVGMAAAGLALVAAGPIGLAAAAPASAFGAAAITGGLAAFGPGGMVGGLATLGALAASGAGVAAGAAFGGNSTENILINVTRLSLAVAADYALKRLRLPLNTDLRRQLITLESQIAAELNRAEPFSDPKAVRIQQFRAANDAVGKLLEFVVDKQIGGTIALPSSIR